MRITNIVIGLCVVLYFVTDALNTNGLSLALIRMGAILPDLVRHGEPWRVVTAMLLHGGLIHLALNCFTLWQIGGLVEQIYGRGRFAALFVLCGVGGGLASTFGQSTDSLIVGASGAIFGLAGCLVTSSKRYPTFLPTYVRRVLWQSMIPFIGYNLVFGLLIPGVDNWAHIGGLLTGIAAGFLVVPGRRLHWSQWLYGTVALAVTLWALASQSTVQWKYTPEQLLMEELNEHNPAATL